MLKAAQSEEEDRVKRKKAEIAALIRQHIEADKLALIVCLQFTRVLLCVLLFVCLCVQAHMYAIVTCEHVLVCMCVIAHLCSWHIAAKFLFVEDEEAALVSEILQSHS